MSILSHATEPHNIHHFTLQVGAGVCSLVLHGQTQTRWRPFENRGFRVKVRQCERNGEVLLDTNILDTNILDIYVTTNI